MPSTGLSRTALLFVAFVIAGCGEQADGGNVLADTTAAPKSAPTADELDIFCAAFAVLDTHDGTTEASVAVTAIEEARESAPAAIREDVDLLADTLIVNNYPSNAEPSMKAAPLDQLTPASERLREFVDENCGPAS